MILNDVTNRAGFIIKNTPALDSEVFCHRDLHAFDMITVPKRLQERVSKAEKKHIMHRPLPQVMVNAKDGLLVKRAQQGPVENLCGDEIAAKGLFDDNSSPTIA